MQPKYTRSKKDVGSPKSTSLLSTFHTGSRFSFQPSLCHPHTPIRIILFLWWTKRHSQFGIFPSHVAIGFPQIAFPTIVLPDDDRTDSASIRTTGSSILDHGGKTVKSAICTKRDQDRRAFVLTQIFCWNNIENELKKFFEQDWVSKFCTDAGFLTTVEVGQYFMTKDTA